MAVAPTTVIPTPNTVSWERNDRQYVFGAVSVETMTMLASTGVGAGVANTAVQAVFNMPGVNLGYNVVGVMVMLNSLDALTDSFNLVVGPGSYTSAASSVAGNDNSRTPTSGTNTYQNIGVCTNLATLGNTVFGADLVFSTANFPAGGLTATNGLAPGLLNNAAGTALTPSNGSPVIAANKIGPFWNTFIPINYDAVYPAGVPLTLRCTTSASTGYIDGIAVSLLIRPVTLFERWNDPQVSSSGTNVYVATPGQSY